MINRLSGAERSSSFASLRVPIELTQEQELFPETVRELAEDKIAPPQRPQASHGGEITHAVQQGIVSGEDVTELGAVIAGDATGRTSDDQVTMFDSTGLAIQDLAIAHLVLRAWSTDSIDAPLVRL